MSKSKKNKGKKSKGKIRELPVRFETQTEKTPEGAQVLSEGQVAAGYMEDDDKTLTIAFVPVENTKNLSSINLTFDLTRPPDEAARLLVPMIRQFAEFALPTLDAYFCEKSSSGRSMSEMADAEHVGLAGSMQGTLDELKKIIAFAERIGDPEEDQEALLEEVVEAAFKVTPPCGDPACSCGGGEKPESD